MTGLTAEWVDQSAEIQLVSPLVGRTAQCEGTQANNEQTQLPNAFSSPCTHPISGHMDDIYDHRDVIFFIHRFIPCAMIMPEYSKCSIFIRWMNKLTEHIWDLQNVNQICLIRKVRWGHNLELMCGSGGREMERNRNSFGRSEDKTTLTDYIICRPLC